MSMSVGASSSAASYLQQLMQQATAGAGGATGASDTLSDLLKTLSGSGADPSNPPTPAGAAPGGQPFDASMMDEMLKLQDQSNSGGSDATGTLGKSVYGGWSMSQMFATFDTNGDGQISKSEFDNAFSQAGVDSATTDAAFAKLDANGDGAISQDELAKAKHGHGHHHMVAGGGDAQKGGSSDQSGLDALLSGASAAGATTKSITNADGSTTTTISYADGTSIDMTVAAQSKSGDGASGNGSNGGSNQASSNLLEQLIRLQSQMLTAASSTMSAVA